MTNSELSQYLQEVAPLAFQESYDNCGLLVGNPQQTVKGVLITLDVNMAVIDEAVNEGCNFILAHHPVIFHGLKRLAHATETERIVIKAIKEDIAIYAMHTNADAIIDGLNNTICSRLGLIKTAILQPFESQLMKLVTYVPKDQAAKVREAIFDAGAGHIGNYDKCSFNCEGLGSFRGNEQSQPFVGQPMQLHFEPETRIETIFPAWCKHKVVEALLQSHPYEEVAYDLYKLENTYSGAGMGMTGYFEKPVAEQEFLELLKNRFHCRVIKHTALTGKKISKVAVCGGTGAFLIPEAIRHKADAFVTADIKYHQFFDASGLILLADIGHYESEQFIKDFFYSTVLKKITNFAVRISKINTNPINYY